jgi:hypothetical protein
LRRTHRFVLVASIGLVTSVPLAPVALAGDDARDPITGDPERFAEFSSRSIALAPAALPEGWTLLDATTEGAEGPALEAALRAVVADVGLGESAVLHVERRALAAPGGEKAHVAILDLEKPAPDLLDALRVAGKPKGWFVREAGTARHLLVVAAPEAIRERVVELQGAFAVHLLVVAMDGALARGQGLTAVGYGRIALAFEPKLAKARYLVGITAKQIALGKRPTGDLGPAIEHLTAALADDAVKPLGLRDRVSALGNLGQAWLNRGGHDAPARDLLKKAVGDVGAVDRTWGIAFRYDLACAHGRLKELDAAFELLGAVLADHAKEPVEGIEDLWRKDPDFTNLREDPRWRGLLAKHPETSVPK